ncbi:MAG: endolytic transglycosylase MltG [Spirochaetia bacterium]|nr:endolytic transglycosylase MltG [Spirochaetia bacterium]
MRKVFIVILVLLLIAGAASAALVGIGYYLNSPVEGSTTNSESRENSFNVSPGEAVSVTAERLAEKGHVRSKYLFIALSKLRQTQASIKSGYYSISNTMTTVEIHNMLVAGTQQLVKVTLAEGLTARQIGARFEEAGVTVQDDFLDAIDSQSILNRFKIEADSLEGYLYPDTYLFQEDYPAEKVVTHLVETMFEKLQEIYPEYTQLEWKELHSKIILASIVEREYRDPEEAAKIASVFYNRLERGMRLQSCATVVYVMTEIQGEAHPEKITFNDLEIESKYNTYTEWGLPPAPIANPGIVALRAVFYPADTESLYFLLKDPDAGQHVFTKTLNDHNRAYRLYIKQ